MDDEDWGPAGWDWRIADSEDGERDHFAAALAGAERQIARALAGKAPTVEGAPSRLYARPIYATWLDDG